MRSKFSGPYEVIKRLSPTNYIISTPDRRRSQRLCHINMLKEFHARDLVEPVPVALVRTSDEDIGESQEEDDANPLFLSSNRVWLNNSTVLEEKLPPPSATERRSPQADTGVPERLL